LAKNKISGRDFLKATLSLGLFGLSQRGPLSMLKDAAAAERKNVLIIVFDALSGQHLPFYGYPRQTTPNLARLAERANVYYDHHSTGNFTTPGTTSILTGVYPWSHRALHLHGPMLEKYTRRTFFGLAAPEYYGVGYSHNLLVTSLLYQARADLDSFNFTRELAYADLEYSDKVFPNDYNASIWSESMILRDLGNMPSSLFFSQIFRMLRGLRSAQVNREYGQGFPDGIPQNNDVHFRLEKGIDWCIDQVEIWPQPFLAYLHFMPPHYPYLPRQDFINRFADGYRPVEKPRHRFSEKGTTKRFLNEKRQAYDEYLAYADSEFGRLYDHLQRRGLLENTTIIFTSDHGEMFERGIWGHSTRVMYEPLLRVPLLYAKAGQSQRQDFHTLTSSVDLLPTLLSEMGLPAPEWGEGEILPGFSGRAPSDDRRTYAMELKENAQYSPLTKGTFVLYQGAYKFIHYQGYKEKMDDKDELYNLENDPEELDNRVESEKSLAVEFRQQLAEKIQAENQRFQDGG
jgi:arylsulfatase A-like enzyme